MDSLRKYFYRTTNGLDNWAFEGVGGGGGVEVLLVCERLLVDISCST